SSDPEWYGSARALAVRALLAFHPGRALNTPAGMNSDRAARVRNGTSPALHPAAAASMLVGEGNPPGGGDEVEECARAGHGDRGDCSREWLPRVLHGGAGGRRSMRGDRELREVWSCDPAARGPAHRRGYVLIRR